jgi:hypothetical protein
MIFGLVSSNNAAATLRAAVSHCRGRQVSEPLTFDFTASYASIYLEDPKLLKLFL